MMIVRWIRNIALGGIADAVKPFADWLGKREDAKVSSRRIDADVARKWIDAALREREVSANLMRTMMGHPLWWFLYLFLAFPVALYHAAIFLVSIFDMFLNMPDCGRALRSACGWYVRRVPPEQEQLGREIVQFLLTAHVGSGIAAGGWQVLDRFLKGKS